MIKYATTIAGFFGSLDNDRYRVDWIERFLSKFFFNPDNTVDKDAFRHRLDFHAVDHGNDEYERASGSGD